MKVIIKDIDEIVELYHVVAFMTRIDQMLDLPFTVLGSEYAFLKKNKFSAHTRNKLLNEMEVQVF